MAQKKHYTHKNKNIYSGFIMEVAIYPNSSILFTKGNQPRYFLFIPKSYKNDITTTERLSIYVPCYLSSENYARVQNYSLF